MSSMRQMPLKQFPNIGPEIDAVITSAFTLTQESDFVHLVLDSYIQIIMSLKEGERMRHAASGIDIIGMDKDTPIPQQLDKLWALEENTRNLQLLVRDVLSIRRSTLGE